MVLSVWLALAPGLFAASAIFGGGPFYTGGTSTMNTLRSSGFTTVILWCIHVDATTGNLIYNDQLVVSNGVYVGNSSWPSQLATLKVAPTSVNRIEVSVSSWGVNDFQSIQTLMNTYGTNTSSILYRNFLALKNATGADAIDYDDETLYDAPTSIKFGLMLSSLGLKVTLCPYTYSSYWQSVYDGLGSNIVDAVYLQCYSGGTGNDPGTWNSYFNGLTVMPGLWCKNGDCTSGSSASDVAAQMAAWRAADNIPGGFMWLYDDMLACSSGGAPADYAAAINRAVDPLDISPASGFSAVAAYNLRTFPLSTPFTLTNESTNSINWSLINTSSWLSVSSVSGTLAAGSNATVTVNLITGNAIALPSSNFTASIVFTNKTTKVGIARVFTLDTAIANWPMVMGGLNAALLASNNATAANPGATAFDVLNNYCFYQQGLPGSSGGLPSSGVFASLCDSATAFQLGSYGALDALLLGYQHPLSGTLTLVNPTAFGSLAILATSANGGGQGTFVLNFNNGTHSGVFSYNAQDWFYTVTNVALQGFGRLQLGSNWNIENDGSANPNLYETTVNLAALGLTQPISSITFSNPANAGSTQTTAILAVSGRPTSIPVSTPTGLAALPGTNATIWLSWNASAGATNYNVKQSSTSGGSFALLNGVTATNCLIDGLANGSTYYFVVSAVGPINESANSSPVSVIPGSYAGWAMGPGAIAYWPLSETSGAVAHDVIQGQNGAYTGGCVLGYTGATGAGFGSLHHSIYFNGSSSYVLIPRLIGDTNFSIAFWVHTTATGGTPNWYNGEGLVDGEVSGTTGDLGVALVGSKVGFGIGNPDTTLTSTKSINDGLWHLVTVTRNSGSGTMAVYIDGKLDNSTTGPTGVRTNSPALHIGSIQTGTGFFAGNISDVSLYGQVLTASQIANLYSAATGLFYDVTLTNQWVGSYLRLTWPGNGKLLSATNVAGPWTTNQSISPATVVPSQSQMYFRIQTQ